MIKDQIIKALENVTGVGDLQVEFTENETFGDYSSNVAMVLAKGQDKNPKTLAEDFVSKLEGDKDLSEIVEKIEVAGPGFINFWLKKDVLIDNLISIDSLKGKYGDSDLGKGKTAIIDYSSPNIAKPFGIGHLRSTIIGQALYNLYKFIGYEVIGDNHLGDWGTQFGKLLYMLHEKNMIEEKKIKDFGIARLEKLYVEFHKKAEKDPKLEEEARTWFKKLEDGDSEARKVWQKCVEVSLSEFGKIYDLLEVKIDFAFGESYYESEMKQMLEDSSIKKHLSKGENGAKIIDLVEVGIKTPLMFLKKDGATTYATRDLATIKFRVRKWDPSIIIYEVSAEQTLYFKQLFAAARILGLVEAGVNLVHTAHGLYLAPDGKKFSTRKGKTVRLEEVLNEAIERAKKLGSEDSETAKMVGVGAIKYFDLMHSLGSDIVFDWEKIMNMEGNSGPYIQYTVARINSVLEKGSGVKKLGPVKKVLAEESRILRTLIRFSEVIATAAKSYSPNLLCNYLYDLASKYNAFYNKDKIIGSENEEFRLALTSSTGQILKNGLNLLGISSPDRM